MNDIIRGEEIEQITRNIFADLEGGKRIDEINIYNKPNKAEVHELIQDLFGIIYPGYFRDRSYKTYNPKNNLAVIIEVAAMNNRHKRLGYNAAQEFAKQLDDHFEQMMLESQMESADDYEEYEDLTAVEDEGL